METDNFITENFPENGRKLESIEIKIKDIFIQSLAFNETIIPLTLVGYELMIADSVLGTSSASKSSYPTRVCGIIVKYSTLP